MAAASAAVVAIVAAVAAAPGPAFETGAAPAFAHVRASWCPSDLRVMDRHGDVIHETRTDPLARRLSWSALGEVSPALVRAVLLSEDRRFAQHHGVDWRAVAAAAWQRLRGGGARGASTITMQLAALLDPGLRRGANPRGLLAKWKQMRAAWVVEERWSKDQILEAYLNMVTFRGEVQGVHAAADVIFGKAPHGLSVEEGATLAASIRSPNATPTALLARSTTLMAALGMGDDAAGGAVAASDAPLEAAVARLTGAADERGPRFTLAPHAARQLTAAAAPCRDVPSSLDAGMQAVAAESLRRHLLDLQDRSAADGAVLVVDNASGEVLAYVGSSGALSGARQVDGVRAARQAGSTLKPFLYASALDRGLVTPATLLEDAPLEVAVGDAIYRPANYDNRFHGLVSVRSALASSLNIPAVRTLLLVGDEPFAQVLRDLGFRGVTEQGNWYGPSLALGSADVSLWELVGAYRALARDGEWNPLGWDRAATAPSQRVFRPSSAYLVADMLADRESRAATFDLQSPLSTRFWTAVKTGTSKDMRDNWCIGFSRRYTVGVWVGNFPGEPMHDVSGVAGAAPVWREVMDALHHEVASPAPEAPADVVSSWTAFPRDVEPARRELYRRGSEPLAAAVSLDDRARISAPTDGSVMALDPDIPAARQRVPLLAHAAGPGLAWHLDGRILGSAATPLLWEPVRGRHELVLRDEAGRQLDVVRFDVKGFVTREVQESGKWGQVQFPSGIVPVPISR